MKIRIGLTLLMSVLFSLIFYSCDKESEADIETSADILVSKTWTLDRLETNATDSFALFYVDFLKEFYTGIVFNFKEDGTLTLAASTGSIQGTWTLSDNEEKFSYAIENETMEGNVMNITKTDFSYYMDQTIQAESEINFKTEFYFK